MTTHVHHRIPRHAWDRCHNECPGWNITKNRIRHTCGLDDANNLIELSIQDHAEEHKWRFIETGDPADAIAWMALYGLINAEEARLAALRLSHKDPERNKKISLAKKGKPNPKVAAALRGKPSPKNQEFRKKVRKTLQEHYRMNPLPVGFGDGSAWKGRKHKEETKQNHSKLLKGKSWKLIDGKRVWMERNG
jgi:hypothetical protein